MQQMGSITDDHGNNRWTIITIFSEPAITLSPKASLVLLGLAGLALFAEALKRNVATPYVVGVFLLHKGQPLAMSPSVIQSTYQFMYCPVLYGPATWTESTCRA